MSGGRNGRRDEERFEMNATLPFLATSISSSVQREVSPVSPAPAKSREGGDADPLALTERQGGGKRQKVNDREINAARERFSYSPAALFSRLLI